MIVWLARVWYEVRWFRWFLRSPSLAKTVYALPDKKDRQLRRAAILTDTAAGMGKLAGIAKSTVVEDFLASGRRTTPAGEHMAVMAELFPYKKS